MCIRDSHRPGRPLADPAWTGRSVAGSGDRARPGEPAVHAEERAGRDTVHPARQHLPAVHLSQGPTAVRRVRDQPVPAADRPAWQPARSAAAHDVLRAVEELSLIHISEPTRLLSISYAVFCLKKKKK